jgi:hypothetical protein
VAWRSKLYAELLLADPMHVGSGCGSGIIQEEASILKTARFGRRKDLMMKGRF